MPRFYFENCDNSRAKISLPHPGKAAGAQFYPLPARGGNDKKKQ